MNNSFKELGRYSEKYNSILNLNMPLLRIVQSDGLIAHISKKHPLAVKYISNIPDILSSPDYIGNSPREPDSIELVKKYSDNVLVAVKLDLDNGYYYVASLYDITEAKLNNRLNSGRLKQYSVKNG